MGVFKQESLVNSEKNILKLSLKLIRAYSAKIDYPISYKYVIARRADEYQKRCPGKPFGREFMGGRQGDGGLFTEGDYPVQ
jgi:hypothetical protein